MAEVEVIHLRNAGQNTDGVTATLAQSVPVRETFEGRTVSESHGMSSIWAGHPTATRARK